MYHYVYQLYVLSVCINYAYNGIFQISEAVEEIQGPSDDLRNIKLLCMFKKSGNLSFLIWFQWLKCKKKLNMS